MNDHDHNTLDDINRLVDEGQPASNNFLNELAHTRPVATSTIKARIESRLMAELAERKREKVNANGHFELDFARTPEDSEVAEPPRRRRSRLPLTMAATVLIVLFAGLFLLMFSGEEPPETVHHSQVNQITTATPSPRPFETPFILYHTVRQGDTCQSVALFFHIDIATLIAANDLDAECSFLEAGRVLVIPLIPSTANGSGYPPSGYVPVVIARQDLQVGMEITEQHIAVVYYPPDLVPLGAIADPSVAYGRVVGRNIPQYVPLLTTTSLIDDSIEIQIITPPIPGVVVTATPTYNGSLTTDCPQPLSVELVLQGAAPVLELNLLDVLPQAVEVQVTGYAAPGVACLTLDEPFVIGIEVSVPPIDSMTDEAIIEAIVYAFPEPYLPDDEVFSIALSWIRIRWVEDDSLGRSSWIRLAVLDNARQQDLHGQALMDALGLGSHPFIQLTPTLAPSMAPTPTECPPASTPERALDGGSMQDALTAALGVPIEVSAIGFQNCPGVVPPDQALYTVHVPQIEGMRDAELVEIIVYALPQDTLTLPGLITIVISDRTSLGFSIDIDAVREARQQDLHGQALMNALGLGSPPFIQLTPTVVPPITATPVESGFTISPSAQTQIDIPFDPAFAPPMVVGNVLVLEFVSDGRTICDAEDVIELVQSWWQCVPVPQNDILSTRIPLRLESLTAGDSETVATFTTDHSTASVIGWLLEHNISYRLIDGQSAIQQPNSTTRALIPVPQNLVDQIEVGDHVTVVFRIEDRVVCGETALEAVQSLCRDDNLDVDGRHILQTMVLTVLGIHEAGHTSTLTVTVDADLAEQVQHLLTNQAVFSLKIHEGEAGAAIELQPNQITLDIPISLQLTDGITLGDRVTLRFAGADFDEVCNPPETAPDRIQQECQSAFQSFNTSTISFTAPSLTVLEINILAEGTTATLAAEPATAEAITWLFEHGAMYVLRVNGETAAIPTWRAEDCPPAEEVQAVLDTAQTTFQTVLVDTFTVAVAVRIGGVEACPDLSRQIGIWYQVDIPSGTGLTDTEIIQAVVYAIPDELLPQALFTLPFAGVTISISTGDDRTEYSIDVWTLKSARDRGFGGQALMDALQLDLTAD